MKSVSTEDVNYFEKRAEAEIELAASATDVRAVRAHYELANHYLDRIHGDEPKAGPNSLGF